MTDNRGVRPDAFDSELSIQAVGPAEWRLTSPLIWTGTEGDTFIVPLGFRTDFATVPRILHWRILPYGPYTRAAVLHDWLLTELAAWHRSHPLGGRETWDTSRPMANSRDADGIFRRAMEDLGVRWSRRWIMWAAVRWGALFNPRRAYGRQIWRDLPAMLGMSALLLLRLDIVAGVTFVAISLGVDGLVRLISSPWSRDRGAKQEA